MGRLRADRARRYSRLFGVKPASNRFHKSYQRLELHFRLARKKGKTGLDDQKRFRLPN